MRRRQFITLLGGTAAWPLVARAQQAERIRRIGVLMNLAAEDPESQRRVTAFVQGLQELGWTDGRNVRIETRGAPRSRAQPTICRGAGRTGSRRYPGGRHACFGRVATGEPVHSDRVRNVVDPVGAGFAERLSRPGGNATGFTFSSTPSAGNGWSCSRSSCRA